MKKLFFTFFFLFFTMATSIAATQTYFRADYGLGKFTTDKLDALNANPSGSSTGFSFGSKMSYIELGAFYRKFSFESDINHDGVANKISHDGSAMGVEMSVFLNNHLGLKLGYAFHSFEEKLATQVSAATLTAIETTYGFREKDTSYNIFYGINYDVFASKKYDLYASVLQFPMGHGRTSTTAQVGVRLYLDSSFADFFGAK